MVHPKNIAVCKPASQFIDRHTEVVSKLRIIRKQNDEATEAANERKRLKAKGEALHDTSSSLCLGSWGELHSHSMRLPIIVESGKQE